MKNKIVFLLGFIIYLWSELTMGENALVVPNGRLIFGSGQGLYEMNLQTCKIKNLFSDNLSTFTQVSKVDENSFLFSKYGQKGINSFNVKTRKINLIYKNGSSPYYNSTFKKIFFYHAPSYEIGNSLYEAEINNPSETARRITGARYADQNIIPVSENEIVFIREDSGNSNTVYSYDITTKKLKQLPIQDCTIPDIWRSKTKQLMCFNRDKKQYFLTDLSGKNVEVVKIKPTFWPVLYLPELDELLFTTVGFGLYPKFDPEKGYLGIYNFTTGQSKIICDDVKLGTGDAAYYEN
jgi:hypothetical protein